MSSTFRFAQVAISVLTEVARQPSHVLARLIRVVTQETVTLETIIQQIQYHQDDGSS